MELSDGFGSISRADARILILGSLPGQRSIAEQQYYAHPQNVFWPIMREIYGIKGDYDSRCQQLQAHGVALWDVLHRSERPGSLDADIRMDSAQPNDFSEFFAQHNALRQIAFNGRKAEQMFWRFVDKESIPESLDFADLPSTSPAYAAMPFSGKLSAWAAALQSPQ